LQYFADYNEFPDSTNTGRSSSSDEMPVRRRTPRSNEDVY